MEYTNRVWFSNDLENFCILNNYYNFGYKAPRSIFDIVEETLPTVDNVWMVAKAIKECTVQLEDVSVSDIAKGIEDQVVKELKIAKQLKDVDHYLHSYSKLEHMNLKIPGAPLTSLPDVDTDRIQIIADDPYHLNFIFRDFDNVTKNYPLGKSTRIRNNANFSLISIFDGDIGIYLIFDKKDLKKQDGNLASADC